LSSINGIDPIVVDTIKVQTQKQVVLETQKTKISDKSEERKDQPRENSKNSTDQMQSLLGAVEALNNLLKQSDIPLYLKVSQTKEEIKVRLISSVTQETVAEISPEKVLRMLREFNTRGFALDELI
jgi:FlaG protein.